MSDRYQVIEKVEDYWRQAGLASSDVVEMKTELRQHLVDAQSEGHSVADVVGDTAIFTETWAEARRGRPVATWNDVQSGNTRKTARISRGPRPVRNRDHGRCGRRSRKRTRR